LPLEVDEYFYDDDDDDDDKDNPQQSSEFVSDSGSAAVQRAYVPSH